jgi:catechol 2,3-dioxygenase-like lactoylglutathione lyase family enzyme
MKNALPLLALAAFATSATVPAGAQLAEPNAAGVAMGHLHYVVRDVEANKRFWLALGGEPKRFGANEVISFPDVLVFLREGEYSGTSQGSVLNHVAFRVRSLADIEAAGFDVTYLEQFPGVAYIDSPEGERIELFDDELATNLDFTPDAPSAEPSVDRHNRAIDVPIVAHHVHLYVPEDEIEAARDWYARHFGGVPGRRWRYDATDLPGINFNFSPAAAPLAGTQGRTLDHIGFEVENLEAFCAALEAQGVEFDRPYTRLESGLGLAFLTDPWGTYIELTEGLRDL